MPQEHDPVSPDSGTGFALSDSENKQSSDQAPLSDTENRFASHPLKWTGCRYDCKAFRFEAICLFVFSLAVLFGASFWPGYHCQGFLKTGAWVLIGVFLTVIWIRLVFRVLYSHYTIRYKLDQERLLVKRGLIKQTTDTILIAQMNDIKMTQTIWDRFVNGGVGTISIFSNDATDPKIKLLGVDKPQEAFETLDDLRKKYVARRGIKTFTLDNSSDNNGSDSSFLN